MESALVRDEELQSPCAFGEPGESLLAEFARAYTALIDAYRRQQRQTTRMAQIEQPIEMAARAVHLMARLRPIHVARCCKLAVSGTRPTAGGRFQVVE